MPLLQRSTGPQTVSGMKVSVGKLQLAKDSTRFPVTEGNNCSKITTVSIPDTGVESLISTAIQVEVFSIKNHHAHS